MRCPKCHGEMRRYERSGVVVDQCGECRGVFLDDDEVEQLIDAENAWHRRAAKMPLPQAHLPSRPYREYDPGEEPLYGHDHGYGRRKKRRAFVEELFD